jgi:hypothetical protein
MPWLADLVALEWARSDAQQALDVAPFTREELAGVPPEEWPGLSFAPAPGVALLELAWDVPSA